MNVRRLIYENGLSVALIALFLVSLTGQVYFGWHADLAERVLHDQPATDLPTYLRSGTFLSATMENWESEFFQMACFLVLGSGLRQKGSAESRPLDPSEEDGPAPLTAESPGPARSTRLVRWLYSYSLSLTLFALFLLTFLLHLIGSLDAHNEEAAWHGGATRSLVQHLVDAQFWFESLQNWQSEFLSVLAMVVMSIWLRHDGSPESKDVNEPHGKTGTG